MLKDPLFFILLLFRTISSLGPTAPTRARYDGDSKNPVNPNIYGTGGWDLKQNLHFVPRASGEYFPKSDSAVSVIQPLDK